MKRVRAYIDAFNLYHAIQAMGEPDLKWLDLRLLCESFLRKGEVLEKVTFFTSIWHFDGEKQKRHKNYITALEATGVYVQEGNFRKPDKYCYTEGKYCPFREEKQTDVAIALEIAKDALRNEVDRVLLLTADSDQIPTAKLVNSLKGVNITLIFPPGRKGEGRDLGQHIRHKRELKRGRMLTCKLPRTVKNAAGKAVAWRPSLYVAE